MKRDWIDEVQKCFPRYFTTMATINHSTDHNNPYHQESNGNLLGHVLAAYHVACRDYPDDSILQFAALMHDIGKPGCMELNPDNNHINFRNHESYGVLLLPRLMKALNLTHDEKVRVVQLVARHGDHWKLSAKNIAKRYSPEAYVDLRRIADCDMGGSVKIIQNESSFDCLSAVSDIPAKPDVKQQIMVLIGPPNSGKSTYVKAHYSHLPVLSRDDILLALAGTDDYLKAWSTVDFDEVDRRLENQLSTYLKDGTDFVVDMTNMTYKTRLKFTQAKAQVHAKVFITDQQDLLKRNANRTGKTLDTKVIHGMCKRFQPPYPGERFSTVEYIFN